MDVDFRTRHIYRRSLIHELEAPIAIRTGRIREFKSEDTKIGPCVHQGQVKVGSTKNDVRIGISKRVINPGALNKGILIRRRRAGCPSRSCGSRATRGSGRPLRPGISLIALIALRTRDAQTARAGRENQGPRRDGRRWRWNAFEQSRKNGRGLKNLSDLIPAGTRNENRLARRYDWAWDNGELNRAARIGRRIE